MYKCISLWLIVLTIIMTFCVNSHQKQPDNDPKSDAKNPNKISSSDDILKSHNNESVPSTESTSLDSKNSLISITRSNVSLVTTNALPTVEISSDKNNSFTTSAGTIQTTGNTPNNVPELTTENLSLTNKSLLSNRLVSESLTSSSVIVKSNSSNYHSVSNSTQNFKSTNKQRTNSNSLIKVSASGGIRISGQKIEMPHLNDFFDHSDYLKKHEHGFRYGPHFETGNVTNITVQVGNTFYLHCKISLLQDKTVSWVRRKSGENGLELLTVGKQTYSGDPRYSVDFQYPNNWRLKIASAQKIDEATYECQISTSPPRFIHYNVRVNAPTIRIVDEQGISLLDKYYEVDSTIRLTCIVRHISMMSSVVYWIHNNFTILNYDVIRGGISVKTDLMEIGANSTLLVAKVNKTDSGNYTCSIGESQQYTVLVHVLNEESLAELHHSGCSSHHIETTGKLHYLNFVMIALFLSTLNQFILCINR